jgi:hypothetical protein
VLVGLEIGAGAYLYPSFINIRSAIARVFLEGCEGIKAQCECLNA